MARIVGMNASGKNFELRTSNSQRLRFPKPFKLRRLSEGVLKLCDVAVSANGAAGIQPRAQRSEALGKGTEIAKPCRGERRRTHASIPNQNSNSPHLFHKKTGTVCMRLIFIRYGPLLSAHSGLGNTFEPQTQGFASLRPGLYYRRAVGANPKMVLRVSAVPVSV